MDQLPKDDGTEVGETPGSGVTGQGDATRAVGAGEDPQPRRSGSDSNKKTVLIALVHTDRPHGDRLEELGVGRLLEPIAVGRPLRIALEGKPAFVTTEVRSVDRLGRQAVEVATTHSVYRLERVEAPRTAEAPTAGARRDARASRANPSFVGRTAPPETTAPSPQESSTPPGAAAPPDTPPGSAEDSTSFMPVQDLPDLAGAPFGPRTRVRIERIKTRDPGSEKLGDLGAGRILDRLEVGECVRLSLDGGPTFVTSAVRALRYVGKTMVEFETSNTTYRLHSAEPVPS